MEKKEMERMDKELSKVIQKAQKVNRKLDDETVAYLSHAMPKMGKKITRAIIRNRNIILYADKRRTSHRKETVIKHFRFCNTSRAVRTFKSHIFPYLMEGTEMDFQFIAPSNGSKVKSFS